MNPTLSSETPEKIPPRLVPHSTPATSAGQGDGEDDAATPGISGGGGDARALMKKRRGRFWKGFFLTGLAGMAAAGLYLTQTTHGQKIVDDTSDMMPMVGHMVEARQNPGLLFQEAGSDVVNILLVGRDADYKQVYKRGVNVAHKVDDAAHARSDTMIVMSLDRHGKTIRMVSLPRDAMVNMPDNPEHSGVDKLNAAHSHGGVPLLKQTLHDELGITIHHYAVIRFDGFKKVIDRVGGVYVDVIGALKHDRNGKLYRGDLQYEDKWGGWKVDLKPGKQWLNGEQAHGYVRFRMDIVGDPGRIQRQQSVMRALARRLKQIPPWEVPGVVKEIRQQFETDLSDQQLLSAGFFAKDEVSETSKIQPITLYGSYPIKGKVHLNRRRNKALLKAIFGPTFNEDNFLPNSPGVRGYEFGPDEEKPEVRRLLIEAGLIEPKPGEAARLGVQARQPSPSASQSPLSFLPGASSSTSSSSSTLVAPSEPRRDVFVAPEPVPEMERPVIQRRVERRIETAPAEAEAPVENVEAPAAAPEPPTGEAEEPAMPADAAAQASPPGAEAADGGELNVESPIPQPE